MSQPAPTPWRPTRFRRYIEGLKTSMRTARIATDAGEAYIKALGNPEGPHMLACELVATELARWLGLPTFDTAIMTVGPLDEIPFAGGGKANAGPAFVARALPGRTWSSDPAELDLLENPDDITRLVVFDCWVLNRDRHPPDLAIRKPNYNNVYFSEEHVSAGKVRLVAMDHTHCFTSDPELMPRMGDLDREQDARLYGLFPAFVPWLRPGILEESRRRLQQLDAQAVRDLLAQVPREWQVPPAVVLVWERLICRRAAFVANAVINQLLSRCP